MATKLGKIDLKNYNLDGFEFEELISEKRIQKRVEEIGSEISKDFENKIPIIIGVLNGSFLFMADLVRNINIDYEVDFIKISSYGNSTKSSGTVRLVKDISADITGRDLIIVEDIVDTGLSIEFLFNRLQEAKPNSISFVTCLKKPTKVDVDHLVNYVGFNIEDSFVIGYGLDLAQKFRGLSSIYNLTPKKDIE
ncbi:MAG: hypoxanthine phosphoribosyltransferase [Candidatus Marinimicrobia bacterium]|nr:hypoxanthine phosphoribosyltransferase [Candidatus Neomarinimicrobiota bacterium]